MKNKYIKTLLYILWDMVCVNIACLFSVYSLFLLASNIHGQLYASMPRLIFIFGAINTFAIVAMFFVLHVYQETSDYRSVYEAIKIIAGCVTVDVIHIICVAIMLHSYKINLLAYSILFALILCILTSFPRYSKRVYNAVRVQIENRRSDNRTRIMIVGAGVAGVSLLREIQNSDKIEYSVKCFVDDAPQKLGTYILGIRVSGDTSKIPALAEKYSVQEIFIAMPSVDGETLKRITDICKTTSCVVKSLPGIYQFASGEISTRAFKEISIEELLARKAVKVDLDTIMNYVSDRVIMVTGGGGSIGSELCRQIASHNPRRLIIVDIYENNAYDIQQELVSKYPMLDLKVLIASVRDEHRMERIFSEYRPQIVYHAAAHKHVPLMEESPNEAIKNNVFGTYKTARLADKYGVKKFVLISTDKAVNPTNVMGATKRLCEMVVQSINKTSKTEFVAVRFGNVLGSNGSVIPLFKKQIAAGGPVLVTHPDIIRYFMTIPEAVALVIQAGAYAKGGEIFVLDMGKPVKILDLAENLIKLSGFVPYKDIQIKFTGLRPGEKLYEEMLMDEEGLQETENKLIHIGKPIEMDENSFFEKLDELYKTLDSEPRNMRMIISELVPTYKGNPEIKNI